jgi:superfamily II DNA or RNA helicase
MPTQEPLLIKISNRLYVPKLPPDLKQALMAQLKFTNPKWIENHRMGRWNKGTPKELRFYRRAGGGLRIPRGYIRHLINLLGKEGFAYEISDKRRNLVTVEFGFEGALKPFQKEAVNVMLAKDFGTLCAPTGSGKTVMGLNMVAKRGQPTLIVVHTKELAYQWVERIEQFLGLDAKEIGFIGDGKKRIGDKITVALVQSLYRRKAELAKRIGFLVIDECHRCPSRTFTEAISAFDCRYMLGLSATPFRRDGLSRVIFWHLGDMHHEIKKQRLVRTGDVLPMEVVVRETDFKPFHDPVQEYSKMLMELTADDMRNRLIAKDVAQEAAESEGVCLVLSDRKRHCENLQALLRYKHKVSVELLTGDLSFPERQQVIDKVNAGEIRVLVATGQLVGEGFDCKNLTTLFLATPIRFSGRVIQYLGRVLRPAPGKLKAKVYDYVDIHVEPLKSAALGRLRVYRQR